MWIKIFYIDNIIDYSLLFITHFYNTFVNIKLLILIHYLCSEMVIIVLLDILPDNS